MGSTMVVALAAGSGGAAASGPRVRARGDGPATTRPRTTRARTTRLRLALIALGGSCLLGGLDAALVRLDVWAPVPSARLGDVHGQVMALGFLATLISLERAQALGAAWGYLAPAAYGVGGVALLTPAPPLLGQLLHVEAGVLFVALYLALFRRTPRPLVAAQALSAVLALGGAVLAIPLGIPLAVPWLVGFLVIMIGAERAELAAWAMGPKADARLLTLACGLTVAILAATLFPLVGGRLVGVVLVVLAAWLAAHDVVRHQLRQTGQRRYIAVALLAAYVSLALAGTVLAIAGPLAGVGSYDVIVHGVLLGFGVAMVMAHAPVILPAVLGRPLPYRPVLWLPLTLLLGGLAARFAGALTEGLLPDATTLWRVGGVVTVLALFSFVLTSVVSAVRG